MYLGELFQVQAGVSKSVLSGCPIHCQNFLRIFQSILLEHDAVRELPEGRNNKRMVFLERRLFAGGSILLLDLRDLQLGDSHPFLYGVR